MSILKQNDNTSDRDLIKLCGFNVYQHPEDRALLKINRKLYHVRYTYFNRASSGLDAMVVENKATGEISLIYEGTQKEKRNQDVLTDGDLVLSDATPRQFKDADQFFRKMKKKYGRIDHVAGNSLGGALANYVAVKEGVHSVTLDPAILPPEVTDDMKGKKTKKLRITNYCGSYDPLTLLEKAAGLENRLPGEKVKLDFGISWFKWFANNHTGYIEDKNTGMPVEKVTIGQKGTVSYGKIRFSADAWVPASVWTGETLTAESAGKGQKIDIDTEHIGQLAQVLESRILAACEESFQYLKKSIDIVETEGSRLDNRKTNLQHAFDAIMVEHQVLKEILHISEKWLAEKAVVAVSPDISRFLKLKDAVHIPLADQMFAAVEAAAARLAGPLLEIPYTIEKIIHAIDKMKEALTNLKYNHLPLIFWGIDNGFLDGIVDELKAHYRVIETNNKNVRRDVSLFLTHTKDVKMGMEKIDREIGEAMQMESGNAQVAATVSASPAEKINCIDSPYLKSGMAIRRNQLNKSFQKFADRFTAFMEPLIAASLNEVYKLEALLCEVDLLVKALKWEMAIIRIPFTNVDNLIRSEFSALDHFLREKMDTVQHLQKLFLTLMKEMPDILDALKPYIETAIFNGTQYEAVILYNKAALAVLEAMKLEFADIAYQLQENESLAISELGKHAANVNHNISTLMEQVKMGTLI